MREASFAARRLMREREGMSFETSGRRSAVLNSTPRPNMSDSCFLTASSFHVNICAPFKNSGSFVCAIDMPPPLMCSERDAVRTRFRTFTQSIYTPSVSAGLTFKSAISALYNSDSLKRSASTSLYETAAPEISAKG